MSNNSIFNWMDNFGLVCTTNLLKCCRHPYSSQNKGVWLLPDKSPVGLYDIRGPYYQERHSSSVTLYRNIHFQVYPEGVFTCIIPDLTGSIRNLFVLISQSESI